MRQFVAAPADLNTMIETARRFGDAPFLVDLAGDEDVRRLTFNELFEARDLLAARLPIARGDHVAICMRNRAEWIIAFLAVIRAGGVAALMNSRGAPSELVAMVDGVAPTLVIADAERSALLKAGGYGGPLLDMAAPAEGAVQPLPDLDPAAPDDPCVILFTSGTTGRFKGAVLTHRNVITGLIATQLTGTMVLHNLARTHAMSPDAIIAAMPRQASLLVYPLFHIAGLGAGFLSPLIAGTKVVIMRRWDAAEAVRIAIDEKLTQFSGVPTMLWDILNHARTHAVDLSGLTNISSGGQALPVNLLDAIRALCPQAVIGTGYGMTECAGAIAQGVGDDLVRARGSAGRVLALADVRVVDDSGGEVAVGASGEIEVRGPMVMQGYWNRPEDNAAAFTPDGWLRTGDIGIVDAQGYVFIIDRRKDMVISGGENIYCAEVEGALGSMPGVIECAAFGIAHERLGEALVAAVVAQGCDEADVKHWVGERLARYKAPAHVIFVDGALPRNHLGKIDKRLLRTQWPHLMETA